jgi:hypothetical protein
LVLLAISGVDDVMTLFTSDSEGNVVLHVCVGVPVLDWNSLTSSQVRNDNPSKTVARVLVGLGDDFESANAAVMYHARGIVSAAEVATGQQKKEFDALKDGDATTKIWAENWYDGLTYCK